MAHRMFKPEYLKAQLDLAEAVSRNFAFGLDEKGGKDVFVATDDFEPKALFAKVKEETGCAKGAWGVCRVSKKCLVLTPEKPFTPLRKQVIALAKAEGWRVKRVRLADEPEVPDLPQRGSELIAGSSGLQLSQGGLTEATAALGEDFGIGARENAGFNISEDQETLNPAVGLGKHGAVPMQSPRVAQKRELIKRYAIGFLCWDYNAPGLTDLAEIKAYQKPTSAYLKAFKGMDKSHQYENPTAKDMESQITRWAQTLAGDIQLYGHPDGWGELVVSFQGHGAGGKVFGVDGSTLGPGKMADLATFAESKQVCITYVLDACLTGGAVPIFQNRVADEVEGTLAAVEKSGEVPAARLETWKKQMAVARRLIKYGKAIASLSGTVRTNHSHMEKHAGKELGPVVVANAAKLIKDVTLLLNSMAELLEPVLDLPLTGGADLRWLHGRIAARARISKGLIPATFKEYDNWMGEISLLQDQVSDTANKVLEGLEAETRVAAKAE